MADWIPAEEAAFDALATQMSTAIAGSPTNYDTTVPEASTLTAAVYNWTTALNAANAAQAILDAAMEAKQVARDALTAVMRSRAADIQASENVTDANRELAGLPVHKTTRTASPVPDTAPVLRVDASRRLEHIVSWVNAELKKARPAGVAGMELFIKVGSPAPEGLQDCRPLGMITRSPNLEEFDSADGGKVAYYIGRWVNTRGEHGPLSEVAAATVAALM